MPSRGGAQPRVFVKRSCAPQEFQDLMHTTGDHRRAAGVSKWRDRARGRVVVPQAQACSARVGAAPRMAYGLWLSDKAGLPNGFEYNVTRTMENLVAGIDDRLKVAPDWADELAIQEWRRVPRWEGYRRDFSVDTPETAYATAYKALKRRIGPAPLREVAFFAGMCLPDRSVAEVRDGIIEFAGSTPDASLSGGRYSREPENVYMNDRLLATLANDVSCRQAVGLARECAADTAAERCTVVRVRG